uniref:Uncharacterized protein MANES_14G116700 n=1 Tax=Rhizophora mucronata TaxID=61149 RepID=A0A2P2LP66_RHIMU
MANIKIASLITVRLLDGYRPSESIATS